MVVAAIIVSAPVESFYHYEVKLTLSGVHVDGPYLQTLGEVILAVFAFNDRSSFDCLEHELDICLRKKDVSSCPMVLVG